MTESLNRLPRKPVDRVTKAFARFSRIEAAAGAALLLLLLCAVGVANSPWSAAFRAIWETEAGLHIGELEFSRTLKHWINDALMTAFFFLVALELKRELVLGELRNPRVAALSFAGALGGMVVPAGIYLTLVAGDARGIGGWGVVMATDTALMIWCLAILGSRVPASLRLFLLSLAIFDDVGAILVVALGYGAALDALPLSIAVLGFAAVPMLGWLGIRSIAVYFSLGGGIWLALDAGGIHPTLAGVGLGLLTPARGWVSEPRLRAILSRVMARPPGDRSTGDSPDRRDLQRAGVAAREALAPLERLEISLHPWIAFGILPLFALANAGVDVTPADVDRGVATAIFLGFTLGKPLGVIACSVVAVRLGMAARPRKLTWPILSAGSLLTGIGFTMAIYIAELAFAPSLLNTAKLGILAASIASAAAGILALALLVRRR